MRTWLGSVFGNGHQLPRRHHYQFLPVATLAVENRHPPAYFEAAYKPGEKTRPDGVDYADTLGNRGWRAGRGNRPRILAADHEQIGWS